MTDEGRLELERRLPIGYKFTPQGPAPLMRCPHDILQALVEFIDEREAAAVRAERERILKLLRKQGDAYFQVGETHSSAGVREESMRCAASWYCAANLLEADFEPAAGVEGGS